MFWGKAIVRSRSAGGVEVVRSCDDGGHSSSTEGEGTADAEFKIPST